jgi:deazaflavin-dependent oxidoreductase (nitroreductase family)
MPALPKVPEPGTVSFRFAKALFGVNTWLYRRTGGRLGNKVRGAPVLLLDHVGRKSGTPRTSPVLYLEDGADLVVVGSRGGSDAMPGWFFNLMATPATTVQVGRERRSVVAREASDEERARLWPRLVEMYPDYEAYQRRTSRKIPVVILSPAK